MGMFSDIKKSAKDRVLLNTLYFQFSRKRFYFEPFYLVQEGLFDFQPPKLNPKLVGCECVSLEATDLKEISTKKDRDQSEDEMLKMLAGSCGCLGVKHNGKIIAYGWYDLDRCNSHQISFPMKENEAYVFGVKTYEAYRGNNLAAYLRYNIYLHLKSLNRTTLYSLTDYYNVPSIKFKRKLGARTLKLYLYIRVGSKYRRHFLLRNYRNKVEMK